MSDVLPEDLDLGQTVHGFVAGQKLFNRYTLKMVLGRGGMGIVWRAFDEELERDVALKFLPDLVIHDKSLVRDLKRETRRSLDLTHPHIVRIHDFVQDAQSACISMEYVDGDTLSNLRSEKPNNIFEAAEVKEYVQQLCEALQYAHGKVQIVHRDLKPANLMVNSRSDLKVTDFGISRSLTDSVSMLSMRNSGTLVYMSPQQLDGQPASPLDDIYSVGATLYELLTSKPPFYSGNLDRQIREKAASPLQIRRKELGVQGGAAIPEEWERTIAPCLAKDPTARPQSAGEISFRLGLGSDHKRPAAGGKRPMFDLHWGRANFRRIIAIGAVVLLVLIGTWAGWWFGTERPRRLGKDTGSASQTVAEQSKAEKQRLQADVKGKEKAPLVEEKSAKETAAVVERKEETTSQLAMARREQPWMNTLGMRFVPVPRTQVLFSIWDTRVQDFEVFAKTAGWTFEKPGFSQGPTHPAVNVSWEAAKAFCRWLTQKERATGALGVDDEYRLPTDAEWSVAVGLSDERAGTPKEKDQKIQDSYPWGGQWPPPVSAGNYDPSLRIDSYGNTSPVGSFAANKYGLYDMGGNVWQWCEDWYENGKNWRVLRGSSWYDSAPSYLLSSYRLSITPTGRSVDYGFRVVVVGSATAR